MHDTAAIFAYEAMRGWRMCLRRQMDYRER